MEAQKLLDAAPFAPEIIKLLKRALEEAWASVSSTVVPDRVGDTRVGLAHALIAHAATSDLDVENLKAAAIEAVTKHPPRASPRDP